MIRRLLFVWIFALAPSQLWAQGAVIETLEELAGRPEPPGFREVLPAHTDLSATLPSPADQGVAGACTSWAATYAAASQAGRRSGLGKDLRLSPSFTYNQIAHDPYCVVGTTVSKTLDLLRDLGALPIEEFAPDAGWCGRLPTSAELQRAARYKIKSWSPFYASNLEAVKGQLARGAPVIFSILDAPEFKTLQGDTIFDLPGVPNGSGHTIVAIGYDDARKAFRIQNSWGRKWADGGYGWLSYGFWSRNVKLGYVID
jgi:C1A family cysteine protease